MTAASTPSTIEMTVTILGCTCRRLYIKARTSPIGRVKCTSSHSSVSLDLNDCCSNSLNLLITIFYLYQRGDSLCSFISETGKTWPVIEVNNFKFSIFADD